MTYYAHKQLHQAAMSRATPLKPTTQQEPF
jgi:hypothetical protein